jgi:hypothetical protein
LAAFGGLTARLDRFNAFGERAFANDLSPYGPLGPVASVNTGETLLSLPAGFQYNVLGRTGSAMTNGAPTPKLHDGMAAFSLPSRPDSWVLVRNHEVADINGTSGIVTGTPSYDAAAGGGTTTVVVDKQTRLITESFASLAGTVRNCAGGRTPWNTWISCEETNVGTSNGFGKPHGYCFEVTPLQPSTPVALKAMGRFRHEAVAVELLTGIVYLTEDNDPAGFYRFLPAKYGQLSLGGRLQMLAVSGRANADLRTGQTSGQRMIVEWVDIGDPDPAAAETDLTAVFSQGAGSGGATFRRLEGCFAGRGSISFTSTTGGNAGFGQVWRYDSRVKSRFGHLTLVFESPDPAVLDLPDNICPGPRDSIVLCEDGSNGNYVRLLSRAGSIADLAQNITPGFEASEFAGSTFSPDGRTLFVNIQTPGITLAIWGAW